MRNPLGPPRYDDFLVRLARVHRSTARNYVHFLLSTLALALGTGVLVYAVGNAIQCGGALINRYFGLAIVGLTGILVGWLIRLVLCLSRAAHKVLIRIDDDYRRACGTDVDVQQERTNLKSVDDGLSVRSVSQSDLQTLSTRDLNAVWCRLVMTPLIVGSLLLLLSICAWQIRAFGDVLVARGVRLEYLCIAGLMFMAISAYLMSIGGVVYKRSSKVDEKMP